MYSSIWYDSLTKPFLQPPAWIFSPVWIIMYGLLLTSIILYTISISEKKKMNGYIYFVVHMIFNLIWSPVFFNLHKIDIALVLILIMDFTAILLISKFFSISKLAGSLLFPYLVWLLFATYLNLQFWRLN